VVKVLHAERGDSASRERFLREARLAAKLDHLYAAHVYDFGAADEGNVLWIAMERVRGVPLDAWLKTHGPMPPEQFGPFFEAVCEVVHAVHELGIVHRDLKPSNIMVVESRGLLLPKLLDFGIAKRSRPSALAPAPSIDGDSDPDRDKVKTKRLPVRPRRAGRVVACDDSEIRRQLTPPGGCLGSPPYMAPEQRRGADCVGPEADIYALGVIACEMLTKRLPFAADRSDDDFEQHRGPVPRLGDEFSPALDGVIRCALDKNPRARYGSALELAADLQRALRASMREQLRTSAQQWQEQCGPAGLLWGADVLEDALRSVPPETLGPLECSFVAESQRRIRRARWVRRSLVVLAAAIAVGGLHYRTMMETRADRRVMEATITRSELEQGQSALLHGEPEASTHLGRAYQRGDRSPGTAFMLARALQPRLAEQARLPSTSGRMWSAAFSPDGRQIVATDDQAAQVWDAQTGKLSFTLPYDGTVYSAGYSADGAKLVVAGGTGGVKIWDAANGRLVRELRRNGTALRYYAAVMSPDGRLIAAIDTRGGVAHVWDAATGELIAEIANDASEFPAIAFSADGRWLATTGGDDVRVFDVHARRQAITIRGPRIRSLAFDPTGPRIITGAATGNVAIWSVPSGTRIQHLRDVKDPVDAVAFSPDGRLVAAGSLDGAIQIWSTESGELQHQLTSRHAKILAVEFDRASRLVLAAVADGTVVVADAVLGLPVSILEGPQNIVMVAHFDPSSRRVVGASLEGIAWVWDATSPYRRWGLPPVADDCGLGPSPEPDRRFIAAGCRDRGTRVWDTARDQLLAELPSATPVGGNFLSASPAVSSAGDRAAIVRGNAVGIYDLPGGQPQRSIVHGAPVSAVAFAATGRDIVSGATDGSLLVTRDGGARVVLPASSGGIDAVSFLPDGRVAAADVLRRLRVYDPGGAVLADLEIPARVMSLRVEGARLVTVPIAPHYSGNPTSPTLVDLERYRVIAQLEGHVGRVFSARWVAGGQILTAGTDGTARLWDGATGQLRQVYQGRSPILTDATLTADGLVMAGSADGLLQFWERDGGRLLWTLRAHVAPIIGIHAEGGDIVTRGFTGELARWTLPAPGPVIEACRAKERCDIVLR
jgi:WD40 repeat protein/serine/threonine protein kinase